MSKRRFTKEEIVELLKNGNIAKCSAKAITYNNEFRVKAIKLYQDEGMTARQIFQRNGFNLDLIGSETPKHCLKAWRKIARKKGLAWLLEEKRGGAKGIGKGRPKIKGLTDADRIKRLELTVAYLKAENDFLAKLRAKQAE